VHILTKFLLSLLFAFLVSCESSVSTTPEDNTISTDQNANSGLKKPITFYGVNGHAILLGKDIKLLDSTFHEIQDISRFHEHLVEVTEVSNDYHLPPSGGEPCDRFKYVKIRNDEFEGYVDGRFLYESGKDLKNKFLTIEGKDVSLVTTHNFGIGTTDEDGLTFCSVRTPVLFSENAPPDGQLVKMVQNENYTDPYPYLELKSDDQADDEILSIEKEQDKYLVKIKREFQEGETMLQLHIFKDANGSYLAEIFKN
jgi:hypothetical protein